MATPASKIASKAKQQVSDNMQKQLSGPLATMKKLESKFAAVKKLHMATYPPINAVKSALDSMAMSDTTSGNPPGTAAALATIGINEGLVSTLKRTTDEYAKIKMKMLQPLEFAKTKLSGELGIDMDQFDEDGYFEGVKDGIYELEVDQELIDETESQLREVGGKYDYTIDQKR